MEGSAEAPPELAPDILYGVAEIAAFIGRSERQTYYALEQRQLPSFKLGRLWCARRSAILRFVEQAEKSFDSTDGAS